MLPTASISLGVPCEVPPAHRASGHLSKTLRPDRYLGPLATFKRCIGGSRAGSAPRSPRRCAGRRLARRPWIHHVRHQQRRVPLGCQGGIGFRCGLLARGLARRGRPACWMLPPTGSLRRASARYFVGLPTQGRVSPPLGLLGAVPRRGRPDGFACHAHSRKSAMNPDWRQPGSGCMDLGISPPGPRGRSSVLSLLRAADQHQCCYESKFFLSRHGVTSRR